MKALAQSLLLFALLLSSVTLCRAGMSKSSSEQTPQPPAELNPSSWKEFSSTEGRFSILFPGKPKEEPQLFSVEGGEQQAYVYKLRTFANYSVVYTDFLLLVPGDSSSTKKLLDTAVAAGVESVKGQLLSEETISLDSYPGRSLKIKASDANIIRAKIYLVGQRLYQVSIITPSEEGLKAESVQAINSIAAKFLDSFVLKPVDPAKLEDVDKLLSTLQTGAANSPNAIVPGGVLNKKAKSLPEAGYPAIARSARASGTVLVKVIIDEAGKVIAAQTIGGHPLLKQSALLAARQARFTPTESEGKPVKVYGIIIYNYLPPR